MQKPKKTETRGRKPTGRVKFEVWAKPENKKIIREYVKLNNL